MPAAEELAPAAADAQAQPEAAVAEVASPAEPPAPKAADDAVEDDPPPPVCEVAPRNYGEDAGAAAVEEPPAVEPAAAVPAPIDVPETPVARQVSPAGSPRMSPKTPGRLTDDSVAMQIQQFLDEWHFGVIHSKLGKSWTRTRVLNATLQIFELSGMEISPKDHAKIVGMEEKAMIYEIVDRMPEELRANIEALGGFLQKVLESVCDVRRVIDDKRYDDLQEVLANSDSTISQELLKQGVVRGAQEVRQILRCRDTWTRSMNARLERLTNSADLAEKAGRQLLAIESQLEELKGGNKEKNTQMLGGMAEKNDKLLMHSVFASWYGFMLKQVAAGNIRKKYMQMAIDAEDNLVKYREKRILNVRNVLMRKAGESDQCLLSLCVETWWEDIAERKKDGDNKEKLLAMQKQMAEANDAQKEATKKVMARMSADSDGALVSGCFAGWILFHESYAKDKELEDAVKKAELQYKEYLSKKKAEATGVLDRMNASTDSGLVEQMFQYWSQHIREMKDERERERQIGDKTMHLQNMRMRQSGNAQGVQTRVTEQKKANLCLTCLGVWQMESKVSRVEKYYTNKIENKRKQLSSVQSLFKSFAQQLEVGLAGEDDEGSEPGTARGEKPRARKQSASGSREDVKNSGRSSVSGMSARPISAQRGMAQASSLPEIKAC